MGERSGTGHIEGKKRMEWVGNMKRVRGLTEREEKGREVE